MNARVFRELHDECRNRVFGGILGYVRNLDEAEEVTAAAFALAFEHRRRFRGESSFYTWVYRIAVNQVRSASRRRRLVSLDQLVGAPPPALVEPDLMDRVLDRDTCCRKVRLVLRKLPVIYRRVLVDHFVRGNSMNEIASLHRIPLGTVLSRMFTAKRLLRRAWNKTAWNSV